MLLDRTDDLTKLPLRGAFLETASAALETARLSGMPVSLMVMDVDHFKLVNDTYGHLQGDDVLVQVAELLRRNLRGNDLPARYAGDEFVALLPNTPLHGARDVAERICAASRGRGFPRRDGAGTLSTTLSIGVAACPEHGITVEALFAAADRALYQVKRAGRDGVALAAVGDEAAHRPLAVERFVGRQVELRSLVRLLEDSAAGRPRVVAVAGEAGVGKTTLLRQLEPEVRLRAGSLVAGRCQEADVRPPYAVWADVLKAVRRLGVPTPVRPWRELPRLVPQLAEDGLAATSAGPVRGGKYVLFEEIAEFLRLAAEERPLVVVLDDMQWASAASWDVLEYLVPQLDAERILFCLTIRSEELRGEGLTRRQRLSRSELFHTITLERLSREDVRQWVEAAFHRQDVGREFLAFLYQYTEGNPLFVVQLLRTLVDEGAVWHGGERWEWRPVAELRLPLAVGDLLSRRLSRLSPRAHAALSAAAVVGREFDLALVLESGQSGQDDMLAAIDEAVVLGVVVPAPGRERDCYAFAHVLLAEVLRDALPAWRRQRLHARLARALEHRSPGASAQIARHADLGGDRPAAYRHAIAASEQSRLVYAHGEAAHHLRTAERNAQTPGELAEVRARLARIAEAEGRYADVEELAELAVGWFAGRGDRRRTLELRRARERARVLLGRPAADSLAACEQLAAEARLAGYADELVPLLGMISDAHAQLGDAEAAERTAWECVHTAGAADGMLRADALTRLGAVLGRTRPQQALRIHRQALEVYQGTGDARGQSKCYNNIGIAHARLCEWSEARQALGQSLALARTAGTPDLCGLCLLNMGVVDLRCGAYDDARDRFGEALALFASVRESERQLYALFNLAHLDQERGEHQAAAELYEASLALARRLGHAEVETGALAGAGLARLAAGDIDAAAALYQEAERRVSGGYFPGRELLDALAVQLAARRGDTPAALRRFDEAHARAEEGDAYGALWLAAECVEVLRVHGPDRLRAAARRHADRLRELGDTAVRRRLAAWQ